jgi:hypothetical protein
MGRRRSAVWLGAAVLVAPLALIQAGAGSAQAEDRDPDGFEVVQGAVSPAGRVEGDKAPTSSSSRDRPGTAWAWTPTAT